MNNILIKPVNQFIGGSWEVGSSKKKGTIHNPFNNEVLAEVTLANEIDVNEAYEIAKEAQKSWLKVSSTEKVTILKKAATYLERNKEEIINILIKEAGSSFIKATIEFEAALNILKESFNYPSKMEETIALPSHTKYKENLVYRDPVGVVGVISSFNFPLHLSMRSIVPAIAMGNTVVHKPDLQTAISGGVIIAKMFEESGLPAGVFNLIVTDIKEIGDSFIEHPIPKIISFTGSTGVGKHIGSIAGQHLKKVALELGGNNPFIVLEDANIEEAVNAAVFGKFLHQGQVCMIINRMLVHRSLYKEFVARFVERVSKLPFGNPEDPSVIIGPLINEKQVQKVEDLVQIAKQEGATPVLEGTIEGNVVTPFVFADVTNDMKIAQSEIFGPIATIIPFDNEEEVIKFANDTAYGLSAGIFTKDIEKGRKIARQIESGMAHVNDQSVNDESMVPFGGIKSSGLGRYGGRWALEEFTNTKWISIQNNPRNYPF
ncbi:aldehyde dehydrogenase family protein [Priestia megaterium]|uniref:aldehyde dehydrogenase family protein n=1 Tax=Priestia megaterium TaxID=1404 RepID=UPI00399D1CA3